ncbi:protein phosphatase [Cyanobium sp. NIES-981]|uniref:protein phosphatase n=1 Tax=Cyanobium sp. NIES-981 TaxID=1851505 RepID=UPI0012FBEC67
MTDPTAVSLQGTLFDFAITELVRQHRESFQPLWSAEGWAKLLIWLALNCGCSGDQASLETFAAALGPALRARLRRVYFARELTDLDLQVLADPAEAQALVLPLASGGEPLSLERAAAAVERVGLGAMLSSDRARWRCLEAAVAMPWAQPPPPPADNAQP